MRRWLILVAVLALMFVIGYATGVRLPVAGSAPDSSETTAPEGESSEAWLQTVGSQPAPSALSADERSNIEVYRRATPAVVNITTQTVEWNFFYGAVPSGGTGTGFIVNSDGTIVTNYHVVRDAQQIVVTRVDGSSDSAQLVGFDPLTDLAVVKINPGNSGGPLLDSQGRVVGVNTMIFTPSGGSVGIGFAIPVSTVKFILGDLVRYGRPKRPWLGISSLEVVPELAEALSLAVKSGVLVEEVVSGGPADRAGLHGGKRTIVVGRMRFPTGGDIIVSIDG